MKAVLVNPPKLSQVWAGVPDIFNGRDIYLFPPLGIMYLASAIQKFSRHTVSLIDAQPFGWDACRTALEAARENPDFIGISTQTHNLADIHCLIQGIRERLPRAHIMLGGPHCWSFPRQAAALAGVDSILQGDGEKALPQWLDALENGSGFDKVPGVMWKDAGGSLTVNEKREPEKNLDGLPYPDRDLLPLAHYYTPGMKASLTTTMITSRGCPHDCSFCNTYQRYSRRSATDIVDEMQHCQQKYGIQEIHFIDDLFNRTAERVNEISREILARNLKIRWGFKATCRQSTPEMVALARQAGCTKIHYGVETGTDEGLRSLEKKLTIEEIQEVFNFTKKAGISTVAYMMLGIPCEKTPADVRQSIRFIRHLDPDFVVWALLSPYPDTRLFQKGAQMGLFPPDCWDRFMEAPDTSHNLPTAWEEHMNKDTLISLFKEAHRDFYLNPRKIAATLARISTPEELKRILRGGIALVKMEFLKGNTHF